jgi:competence protein ComEC
MLRKVCLVAIVSLFIVFFYTSGTLSAPTSDLSVTFIDVGQGDAALISDASGFDILIDGGKTSAGPTVVAFIKEQGVDDIDVMVASHADADHIGGLITVLQDSDILVREVYYNGYEGTTNTWSTFATAVANEGIIMTAAQFPQTFSWGNTTAHILNPASGLINPETNDASVVILLVNDSTRFLFTGDIDSTIEATVVARGTPVAAEILKVAHHGSAYSSSPAFLSAVSPADAVISVGDNSYGHPSNETITRLLEAGARIWRTDLQGNIYVTSDGEAYSISSDVVTYVVYLPSLEKEPIETPEPTPTTPVPTEPTPTTPVPTEPTPTTPVPTEPTPTTPVPTEPTPTTPVPTEPVFTGNIVITDIFFDGVVSSAEPDEYVEIRNNDTSYIQLQSWTLRDIAEHVFTFPSFVMAPGQVCRVYTNEYHPEWCGFSYGSGSAIWNNSGDCAYLRDSFGTQISSYCYP